MSEIASLRQVVENRIRRMTLPNVTGTSTHDERAALLEAAIWEHGKSYSELFKRLSTGRVEVHVERV